MPAEGTDAIARAAVRRGLAPRPAPGGFGMLYGEGVRLRRAVGMLGDRVPFLGMAVARSRWLLAGLLAARGLPLAAVTIADSAPAAVQAARRSGRPILVRSAQPRPAEPWPRPLSDPAAIARAFAAVAVNGRALVIDAAPGQPRRALVGGGRLLAAIGPDAAGRPADRTASIGDRPVALALRAAAVLGLPLAMVELVVDEGGADARILDLAADLDPAPFLATARDPDGLADAILDTMLPGIGDGRIPIVAVAGRGADELAGALGRHCAAAGRSVGVAGAAGLSVGGLTLFDGDRRGRRGLPLLIDHPLVDLAIVEIGGGDAGSDLPGYHRLDLLILAGPADAALVGCLAGLAGRGVIAPAGLPTPGAACRREAEGADAVFAAVLDVLG